MQPQIDPRYIARLNGEIEEHLGSDQKVAEKERAAHRIRITLAGIARKLELDGKIEMFGSFSNGFKTGGSDLDIVFTGKVAPEAVVSVLAEFVSNVAIYGFENITKIFSANVPIVKFTDRKSSMEVDFCINNDLGVRNSLLLHTYCQYDNRVLKLGKVVKDWAKRHELVGTTDGLINSYAYVLLVLHYLLYTNVVPNLQALATDTVKIADNKWGNEDHWETNFFEDVGSLPPSASTKSVGELVIGFFAYYTQTFDFRKNAVCMRQCQPNLQIDKFALTTPTNDDQWYIEDPFDLKHNLAGKCSRNGRKRIIDEMASSLAALTTNGSWKQACPEASHELFFLKCRISQGVTPQALLEEFEEFDLHKLHFPKPDGSGRMGQAFLEFIDAKSRRRAHTKNGSYVGDCQFQLHYTSQAGLAEAVQSGIFSTYEMASYKMKKQVLAARVQLPASATRPDESQTHAQGEDSAPAMPPPQMYPQMMPPYPPQMYPHPMMYPPGMPRMMPPHMAQMMPPGVPPYGFPPNADPSMVQAKAAAKKANAKKEPAARPKEAVSKMADTHKIQNAPLEKTKMLATSAKAKSKGGKSSNGSGWLSVQIHCEHPKDTPLLTPAQVAQVEELSAFFSQKRFSNDMIKAGDDHVVLQYELKNDLAPKEKLLLQQVLDKHNARDLQQVLKQANNSMPKP
jgi:hypothetical protein